MAIFTRALPTRRDTYLEEYSASLGESLYQTGREALIRSPALSIYNFLELSSAQEPGAVEPTPEEAMFGVQLSEPKVVIDAKTARDRVKELNLKLDIPERGINEDALNILIERKQDETRRFDIIDRGPQGFLAGTAKLGTAFAASVLDPLNVATAFVPVVNAYRYHQMLANATSAAARAGVRARVGALEGLVGAALVEPIIYGSAQYEQADYDMLDSAINIGFGSVLGGGLHVIGGTGADFYRAHRSMPDPFNRLRGLSVDQIRQVYDLDARISAGDLTTDDIVAIASNYPPAVLRAAGLIKNQADIDRQNPEVGAPLGTVFGESTQVRIGQTDVPARFAVVDLVDIEATMTKADNQWRDRTRRASDAQIREIANNPDYNQLQWSPVMDYGAPTLSNDGLIIGGNGRVMGISTSYDIGKAGNYRSRLTAEMERFGIDPSSVEGMKKPMLVRVLTERVDVKKAAIISNEGGAARMSALEQAGVDSARLGDFRSLDIPENGDLNVAGNRGAIKQWVGQFPVNQQAGLLTSEGYLSKEGMLRLRNAILYRAYGDSPVLKKLIEATDDVSANISTALIRAAGVIADARARIASGNLYDLDISADIQAAVSKLGELRSKSMTFDDFEAQGDLLGIDITPEQLLLMRFMDDNIRSPRAMSALISEYYAALNRAGDPKQADMFGGQVPTKSQLLEEALNAVENDPAAAAKIQKVSAETREAALRVSVAQLAEGRQVEIDPVLDADPAIDTATPESTLARAREQQSPEALITSDPEASAKVGQSTPVTDEAKALDDAINLANDVASRGNEAYKYSRGTERDMMIVHNLSADNLFYANRIGGLAVPSLAVIKSGTNFDGFGEITLIGGREMADPQGYAKTQVFGADIYSPRWPEMSIDLDKNALGYINEKLAPYIEKVSKEDDRFSNRPLYSSDITRVRDLLENRAFRAYANDILGKEADYFELKRMSQDMLFEAGGKEKIFLGHTYSGTRRYTAGKLETVVRILKKELRGGEGFNYRLGNLRAKFAPKFKTIDQIKKAKDRIVGKDEFQEIKREIDLGLDEIGNAFGINRVESVIAMIEDIPRMGLDRAARQFNENVVIDNNMRELVSQYIVRLRDMPTEYFEAKILRAVSISEFRGAAIPINASKETIDILQQSGISDIRYYDQTQQNSRASVVAGFDDFKFSRVEAGEVSRTFASVEDAVAAVAESFGKSTQKLLEVGGIRIVNDIADLPGGPHPDDVRAATAPDGTVYIVSSRVSQDEVRGLVLHEVGEHVGMEQMLGKKLYADLQKQFAEGLARGDEAFLRAAARVPEDTLPEHVASERLAYLIENAPELPLVQRILAAIRAWAYKTFKFVQNKIELTEDDIRALAVSSLHSVARRARMAEDGGFRYSRAANETADMAAELRIFDEAIQKAEIYGNAIRAAAERLGDPASARSAMASTGNLMESEIDDLLDMLQKQNTAVRARLRKVRESATAEDRAAGMQSEAMQAANELANNLKQSAVIQKRNAALNLAAKMKALSFVQSEFEGFEAEGVKALLAGSEMRRRGARASVQAEQAQLLGGWMGGIINDMNAAGLWDLFVSETMARDTSRALFMMSDPNANMSGLPKEAVQMAQIINKYQNDARNTQNRFGSWIRDLKGYIVRQSHDPYNIRKAGYQEWRDFVIPRLDTEKTFRNAEDIEEFLKMAFDDLSSGLHLKYEPDDETAMAFRGQGRSVAKAASQSRVLHFKDGDAWFDYNERFGKAKFADAVLGGLERSSRSAGIMKVLGTNPEATITRLMDQIEDNLRSDPKRKAKFHEERQAIMNLFRHIDGSINIPGSHLAAQIGSGVRVIQSTAKLGGAVISSIPDLAVYASEQKFQGRGFLSGMADSLAGLVRGRGSVEQQAIMNNTGVFFESMRNNVLRRFDTEQNIGGAMASLQTKFFKWNGLTWWTEVLRKSSAMTLASDIGGNRALTFDKLRPEMQSMLGLYNIDAGKWDLIRMGAGQEADGRVYITAESIKTVPREALENYIQSVGRQVNDASVSNLVQDIQGAMRSMFIDRAEHAVIEPDARTRAFWLRGTTPGTVWGETARFMAQFKSFPTAILQRTIGREIYGRGYDTLSDYLKNGKGDMLGLANLMVWMTLLGYGAMSIKDMLKGRTPRDPMAPSTWAAAMLQGGAMGIYGDFLFGEMKNRFGGGFLATVAGPTFGTIEDLADLYGRLRDGEDAAAKAFRILVSNTPFANLFYTRMAMDYLFLYRVQEWMNPGYLRRMERRIEKENAQTFLVSPSEVIR